jgi:hypothetical protein
MDRKDYAPAVACRAWLGEEQSAGGDGPREREGMAHLSGAGVRLLLGALIGRL